MGVGVWDFPYHLNFDDNNIILRGEGPETVWKYTDNESVWIKCRWPKCWLKLQDLTIASNRTNTNDRQFEMSNGGSLIIKNVVFDGENYATAKGTPFWLFNDDRVAVIFEDCYFTNNDVMYEISKGTNARFTNCIFDSNALIENEIMFHIDNANVWFDDCVFINNTQQNGGSIFNIENNANVSITNTSFIQNSNALAKSQLININSSGVELYIADSSFTENHEYEQLLHVADNNDYANIVIMEWVAFTNNSNIGDPMMNSTDDPSVTRLMQHLSFNDPVSNDNILIAVDGTYIGSTGNVFEDDSIQEMHCIGLVACFKSTFRFKNNSICNIHCNSTLSCSDSAIYIEDCDHVHVICNGDQSCDGTNLFVESVHNGSQVNIECGATTSCQNMHIAINSSITTPTFTNVSCIDYGACNNIDIEVNDAKHSRLKLHSYSENVFFDNGFGWRSDDRSVEYIDCMISGKSIPWEHAPNDTQLRQMTEGQYRMDTYACSSVYVGCRASTDDTESSGQCMLEYEIDKSFTSRIASPTERIYVPISDMIRKDCIGTCYNSPTEHPTASPSASPTAQTKHPTNDPTIEPTMDPTTNPTSAPSASPSSAPTRSPSFAPSMSPTLNPSLSPSMIPSIAPSQSPSSAPTAAPSAPPTKSPSFSPSKSPSASPSTPPTKSPTFAPSLFPTLNPSISPSNNPTMPPTKAPSFSPTLMPTTAPSISPSNAPSTPPSSAPTRVPTDDDYRYYVPIQYSLSNLTTFNVQFIVNSTEEVVHAMQEIIERSYFTEETLEYSQFYVYIMSINGKNIRKQEELTVYDLDILYLEKPMILETEIQCVKRVSDSLIIKTHTESFETSAQSAFRDYFNNEHLLFTVVDDELEAIPKFSSSEPPDLTVVYLSVFIVSCGILCSFAAFVMNKKGGKVDNSSFLVPFLISLGIYDFVSDINFTIQVWQKASFALSDVVTWLGASSTFFYIVAFDKQFDICNEDKQTKNNQCKSRGSCVV
eukprot:167937_1